MTSFPCLSQLGRRSRAESRQCQGCAKHRSVWKIIASINKALAARELSAPSGKRGLESARKDAIVGKDSLSFVVDLNNKKKIAQPVPRSSCALQCCEVILTGSQGKSGILKTSAAPVFCT